FPFRENTHRYRSCDLARDSYECLLSSMRRILRVALAIALATGSSLAASKLHTVSFGPWTSVSTYVGIGRNKPVMVKIRALYVDGKLKEHTTAAAHQVTDRVFVVRRVFRINDSLPGEKDLRWQWEHGGWLLVDGASGRVSVLNLPQFHPRYSAAAWYRDYVAYCGLADNERRVYAIVAQIGRRKAVFRKVLENVTFDDSSEAACSPPLWERDPARVVFETHGQKLTFTVHDRSLDVSLQEDEEDD